MKKNIVMLTSAVCMFAAGAAAALPEWAAGSYKGQVRNWCNDSSFSVYGEASLNVASNGKVSGDIVFADGASGKASGKFDVQAVSDGEVLMTAGFRWYDERGKADGSTTSSIKILLASSGVSLVFEDNDDEEDDWDDKCPVAGTLAKTGSGADMPAAWQKARKLMGVATRAMPPPYNVQGVFELKCGKANKQGVAKVSATLTALDGKKTSYKAQSVDVTGTTAAVEFNGMSITIDGESFTGGEAVPGGLSVRSSVVGGNWTEGTATATVDAGDLSAFSGTVLSGLLPIVEVAPVSGGKWKFAKAASVKWAKPKKGAALPEIYDAASGKGLLVDTAKGANLSGLKLTYTPKKGTFKGSFNVYALEGEGKATKLKKHKLNVSGVVVDGAGYGMATCRRPSVQWPMTVN